MERFGKFTRLAEPGLLIVCWPCEEKTGVVSLRVQELKVNCEAKTKDNVCLKLSCLHFTHNIYLDYCVQVFVTVSTSVQYQVVAEKVYQAHYVLADTKKQMTAYVYDVIRSTIPTMTLDEAFESKEEVSLTVKAQLVEVFTTYGYTILQTLVTDLSPDAKVRDAMNEINASKRLKEAAYQRAEGEKVLKVKRAEAEAESMYLSGVGVARQRKAIMEGLRESIMLFSSQVSTTTPADVMDLLILNQYFDTLSDMGKHKGTKCIMLPDDSNYVRNGIMQANSGFL